MYSELRTKIGKGKETMGVVETLLIFAVAAFYFAVVAGRVWTDQLVPDPKACSGQLKACWQVSFAIGVTAGKFEAVVRLHTLYPHAASFEPGRPFLQEVGGRFGALFWLSAQLDPTGIIVA